MNDGAKLVAQERVHRAAVAAVDRVDGGQHVPVHLVPLQHVQAATSPGRRWACRPCPPGTRRASRWASIEMPTRNSLALRNSTPLVGRAGWRWSGSCSGSAALAARIGVPARSRGGRSPGRSSSAHRPARRPPPPGPGRGLPAAAGCRSPADRRPPEPRPRVQHLLGQEEAVLTIQVAHRPGRLGHHMKRQRSPRHRQHRAGGLISSPHPGQVPLSAIFCWASAMAPLRACTWWPSASPTAFLMARVTAGSTLAAAECG